MKTTTIDNYSFSGHESFPCKSLWLKKGYDYDAEGNDFNDNQAVVELGVGKNMVASIRYWLKAFGLNKDGHNRWMADFLFGWQGRDPYMEDAGTLWLLHYLLVTTGEAILYNWFFTDFQRKKKQFRREDVASFVKSRMIDAGRLSQYNENTVGKDIGVLLLNYCPPKRVKSNEDYSALLVDLNLLTMSEGNEYVFNEEGHAILPPDIYFFAVVQEKGEDKSVTFDDILKRLGLVFCMTEKDLVGCLKAVAEKYSEYVVYSDIAGVRQLLFSKDIHPQEILERYYA